MLNKKPLLLILLLTLSLKAFSAVFTVTSNADSGAGTLRDALTQAAANGNATKDYIYFNLTDLSQAGRTIVILTALPGVTSNLVIDASTQAGAAFGVSSAKVAVNFTLPPQNNFAGLTIINQKNVEIYGLYLNNLTDYSNRFFPVDPQGIQIVTSDNIQIGGPLKGNVISGFATPLDENPVIADAADTVQMSSGLILQGNFFGIESDGITVSANKDNTIGLWDVFNTITLGGAANKGNLFAAGLNIGFDMYDTPTNVLIQNNLIGVSYDGITPTTNVKNTEIGGFNNLSNTTINIEDNVINSPIFGGNVGGTLTFLRNYIGVDKTKTVRFNNSYGFGIFLSTCGVVQIGSNNLSDANYIAYCEPIYSANCRKLFISKNSIFCAVHYQPIYNDTYGQTHTLCNILNISANSVSGTATANSNIQLFYSDVCKTCSPQFYFASTNADNNGNWVYNGPINGTVIASATINGSSSEFTKTAINVDNVHVIKACGNGTGSIKGAVPQSAQNIKWVDSTGKVVGTNADLLNVKVGKYKLIASNGACGDSTAYYQIQNKFLLDTSAIKRTEPSCGNPTGSITGLNIINNDPGAPYLIWQDVNHKPLAYTKDLLNVPAGSYYLQVKSADSTCSQTYGPFSLKNVSGPNIDQSHVAIQSTNCGQAAGSITNLTVTGTGTLKFIWWNSQQQTVSTTQDLLNQPAGTYKLEVTDDSQCGPVYTTDLIIPETNGIMMDESKAQTAVASCSNNNGSVTGISVSGATQYKWLDANNKVIGTSADLKNIAAGTYTLTAFNSFGCTATSKPYTVGQLPPTKFPVYANTSTPACFQQTDGSVTVAVDALVKSARWVNAGGQDAGTAAALTNVGAGTYQLYLTDQNGCENYYNTFTVTELPEYKVVSGGTVTNDQCNLGIGSISAADIEGGATPYTYTWYNSNNQQIGTGPSISNLTAGTYVLNVISARCGESNTLYTVSNETADISPPVVSNVALCSSGNAIITVNSPSASTVYRLYANITATQPIAEQKGGRFVVSVTGNTSFYISTLSGSCESTRAEVKVTVGLSALNIANTFTPNGDGINDFWVINGIANYTAAEVQVFTRNGQRVFDSKGYATPFDGTFDGKSLPEGVYYYIIDLHSNCSILSGSLTIIR